LRILIVSPVFWPETFRINDLATELADRGHQVDVLAGMPNYPEGEFYDGYGWRGPFTERWGKVRIFRFPHLPRGKGKALALIGQYLSWAAASLVRLVGLWRVKWDVVFVFQVTPVTAAIPALLASRLRGIPSVVWVLDLWPEIVKASGLLSNALLLRVIGWFSTRLYRSFDHVITQNEGFRRALVARGVEPGRTSCVYSWAEDSYSVSPPAGDAAAEAPWKKGFVVMYTGNLGRMQGVDTLLGAAEKLAQESDINWVFVGDGALRPWMETFARERGLLDRTVHFLGKRPLEEMPAYYAQADAMLLGLGRSEALTMVIPAKLQSYLAGGKPVLASADGEAAAATEASGAGWAAPAEDPDALAALVLRMRRTAANERAEMGRSGRRYYEEHFLRQRCLDAMEDRLQKACYPAK